AHMAHQFPTPQDGRADRAATHKPPGTRQKRIMRKKPAKTVPPERAAGGVDSKAILGRSTQRSAQQIVKDRRTSSRPAGMNGIGAQPVSETVGGGKILRPQLTRELPVSVIADTDDHQPRRLGQML